MASFNKIIIVGYLGRDPELKYTPQGKAVTNFSVATTEKSTDKSGEAKEVTTWFRVSVWDKAAENAATFLKKGSQVYIDGRLRQDEYTDKDGNKRQTLEVWANTVQFLDRKGDNPPAESATDQIRKSAGLPKATEDVPF